MKLNGCHNRGPLRSGVFEQKWAAAGTRPQAVLVEVPMRMNPDCQYTYSRLGQADAACTDCKHRASAEQAAQRAAEKGWA